MDLDRIAELIARRTREDPKVEKIVRDARLFDKLQDDPAWKQLHDYVLSKREGWLKRFTAQMMRGELVDQREVDYNRGFYDGAYYTVRIPEVALENLHRVAERAWALGRSEEMSYDQEESPYE